MQIDESIVVFGFRSISKISLACVIPVILAKPIKAHVILAKKVWARLARKPTKQSNETNTVRLSHEKVRLKIQIFGESDRTIVHDRGSRSRKCAVRLFVSFKVLGIIAGFNERENSLHLDVTAK